MERPGGCVWVVVEGTAKRIPEHCNRLISPGYAYCPKHVVMHQGREDDEKRKMARVRAGKERKALMNRMLENLPLTIGGKLNDAHVR